VRFEAALPWISQPGPLRVGIVLALLFALLVCQRIWPLRGEISPLGRRRNNVLLAVISTLLTQLVIPITTVAWAAIIQRAGIGLFSRVEWPTAVQIAFTVVVLDLAIYWQHRAFHRLPWLWRIHRVHHSDTQFEVTLGLRFHPIEILLSLLYKCVLIVVLGAAPAAVATYEILLAAFALLTHADVAIPPRWDRRMRRFVVTPDWHRVHHSVHRRETDSNYGNLLTLWDRLFASRIDQPTDGHRGMHIGLPEFRSRDEQGLFALLRQPLVRNAPLQAWR
jgi:sterol desaturase/sphingolipid hydroxylase (fatty acid hydroxylase superfamily)